MPNDPITPAIEFALQVWNDAIAIGLFRHAEHRRLLLAEAQRLQFEHGTYQVYSWILSFNAERTSHPPLFQLSVSPQHKLRGKVPRSQPAMVDDNLDEDPDDVPSEPDNDRNDSTYKPSWYASRQLVEPSTRKFRVRLPGSSSTANILGPRSADRESNQVEGNNADDTGDDKGSEDRNDEEGEDEGEREREEDDADGANDNDDDGEDGGDGGGDGGGGPKSTDPDHDEERDRYPDFLVAIFVNGKFAGVHSIWELKRLPIVWFSDSSSDLTKASAIADTFRAARWQIFQQAVCAFSQYPMHNKITIAVAVGCYVRFHQFRREDMPLPGEDWRSRRVFENTRSEFAGPVYHLFSSEADEDYCVQFQIDWISALSDAFREVSLGDDATLTPMPMLDLSDTINELLVEPGERSVEHGLGGLQVH